MVDTSMVVVVRRQNVKTNTQSNFEPPRGDSMPVFGPQLDYRDHAQLKPNARGPGVLCEALLYLEVDTRLELSTWSKLTE
jgi:hypothetical protein